MFLWQTQAGERDRGIFKDVFVWQAYEDGWKPFVQLRHWLGVSRSDSVRETTQQIWKTHTGRHSVYTICNDPLLDPVRPSSHPNCPARSSIKPTSTFTCLLLVFLSSLLSQNSCVTIAPDPDLAVTNSVSHSISPCGACLLTCLRSPLAVRKLIQPVILHAHCS